MDVVGAGRPDSGLTGGGSSDQEQGGEKGKGPEEVPEVGPVDWQVAVAGADE